MEQSVKIQAAGVMLKGDLVLPAGARGLVIFAHGSGSSSLSPRNRYVAGILQERKLGTLLFDLLTAPEETIDTVTAELRFNIPFLASRLVSVTDWVLVKKETANLRIGYFGASTGAAAALKAAATLPRAISAVVSRGGRPDLAGDSLPIVKVPVLLIVGSLDIEVIELNRLALARLSTIKELVLVPDANHLFEEPGTLQRAAQLAAEWFGRYLSVE